MRATLLLALLPLLALPAGADDIYLVDGRIIEKVTVREESLKEVAYTEGNRRDTVPSADVLRVRYTTNVPGAIDRAESAVAQGQIAEAIRDFQMYLDGAATDRGRPAWATPYAAHRLVQLNRRIGDHARVVTAADHLIQSFPSSRYVTVAYLAKAEALAAQGDRARAQKALSDLKGLVGAQELSPRWELEARLLSVMLDGELAGPQKREELIQISSAAGRQFPTVRNKADVAEAEVLLAARQAEDAEKIFRRVIGDPQADGATLAAAYTGLGDVLYQRAGTQSGEATKKTYQEALLAYMRVVVNHPEQTGYVPKALFYAGRSFDLIGAEDARDNSRKLYLAIVRQYPQSQWASEARGFLR